MLENIYSQVLEKLVLPFGDKIDGGGFMHWLRQYRKEQWLPAVELEQLEQKRLSIILEHARFNVPFYKNTPAKLRNPFEDIKQFPILNKHKINENLDHLVILPKEKLIAESSSGSSGIQGTVYMDKSAQASQRAMQMLWFEWGGYQMGDSVLQTGMTLDRGLIKGTKDFLLKTAYVPAFNLEPATIEAVLRDIEKSSRHYLFGYASSLFVLAQAALNLGISTIKFKYAVSWGDKLFPHYRETILQAFGCKTLDTYGCTEGAMIAAQCSEERYHLSVNQCHIEVVDDVGQPVTAGNLGKVLATRLDNFAMPLIRYYLGDLAILEPLDSDRCTCGRQSPLLHSVVGRDTDVVLTRSGKQMIVHFFTGIFEHVPEIKQFKVIQRNLEEIEIQFIPGKDFGPETLKEIESKIHKHLREDFPIIWVKTENISPTKSGKPQIIQSFLKQKLN